MRLQTAIALHDYEEDRVSGFGDRESRRERKAARKERRQDRRETRRERKVDRKKKRITKKRQKIQQRLVPVMVPVQAPSAPALQPAPMTMPPPKRKPGQLLEKAVDWVEEVVDEGEEEPFDEEAEEGDATEGFGAESWGPAVSMGRRLRIQAALGYRAAVIELKPGLFLVAEIPDAVSKTEFGLAPLLAPMMMRAARRSMDEPQERRGPFRNLFRRQQQEPIRYVQVVQAPAQVPAASPAPLALPGPTEPNTMFVAAPNVAWADDATVAATYGCDTCQRPGRR